MPPAARVRHLPLSEYEDIWRKMREWCDSADDNSPDEIWILEHPPVYTLGQAGRESDLLRGNGIPLVRADRGGQITYHGPGQLVAYLLLHLRRRNWGARRLVDAMQNAVIAMLREYGIAAHTNANAPGVYVGGAKIAALGLRIRRGRSYHGLSFNAAMDLSPFADIRPCGFADLRTTQLADLSPRPVELTQVREELARRLLHELAEDPAPPPIP